MAVLVTGGSGFLGQRLIQELLLAGETVVATARTAQPRIQSARLSWHAADLVEFDNWPDLLDGVTDVYHLAWSTVPKSAAEDPVMDAQANIIGSLKLLQSIRKRKNVRVIFPSSGGTVYGNLDKTPASESSPTSPISAYGTAKLAVEQYINQMSYEGLLTGIILRISTVYGPAQSPIPGFGAIHTWCRQALRSEPATIYGSGAQVRDYVYIDDAVRAILRCSKVSKQYVLNVGSGRGFSALEVIKIIERLVGNPVALDFRPARIFDASVSILDITKAKSELAWQPETPLETGIERVLSWLRQPAANGAPDFLLR